MVEISAATWKAGATGGRTIRFSRDWSVAEPPTKRLGFCFDIRMCREVTGYSTYVAQLPGVISQGNDAESALRNTKDAFLLAVETYIAENMPIPWVNTPAPCVQGEENYRVAVNV